LSEPNESLCGEEQLPQQGIGSVLHHNIGDEVELRQSVNMYDGRYYQAKTKFTIIRDIFPDIWILKDPRDQEVEITHLFLCENFDIVEKKKTIPIPKSLEGWFHQTKGYVHG
jgi:hypothetical protein